MAEDLTDSPLDYSSFEVPDLPSILGVIVQAPEPKLDAHGRCVKLWNAGSQQQGDSNTDTKEGEWWDGHGPGDEQDRGGSPFS